MSADNGYIVAELTDKPDKFGVFYYSGDGIFATVQDNVMIKEPRTWPYGARHIYDTATAAIIAAHKIQGKDPTEYGVHVYPAVLEKL